MKYLLFEKSAIERITQKNEFQSIEFALGELFIKIIQGKVAPPSELEKIYVMKDKNKGVIFVGENCEKTFLLLDLEQCQLLEKEKNADSILLILQKVFRTAIRIWSKQPFTFSERINGTKSIVFPFVFSDRRRVVIERAPDCERLKTRGINWPLLVYKYGVEDEPRGGEVADVDILKNAGEEYLSRWAECLRHFQNKKQMPEKQDGSIPLMISSTDTQVSDQGFMYLGYQNQIKKLTNSQKAVVESENLVTPIRIDGAAGTGKTASMILRAYRLLEKHRMLEKPYQIVFFSHSESTKNEALLAFSVLEGAEKYLEKTSIQQIKFVTLLEYCVQLIGLNEVQLLDRDAGDAKQTQRLLIEDALDKIVSEKYKSFKTLLSNDLKAVFNEALTPKGVLISMLQHEFSVQIKGRTDGTIEGYYKIKSINNALPVQGQRDKDFIFLIFQAYQELLSVSRVYDNDDIIIQAIAQLNAPIWRRERSEKGFDYIFVDEMHLFNINEQYTFHYLTKCLHQSEIPICFALDYSQAIGDRGNIQQDYVEQTFSGAESNKYQTVFRSSQEIADFCAAVSASGALMFQSDYRNPYNIPASGFTRTEEALCQMPSLYMYSNDDEMIKSLKEHIDTIKKETHCRNREIALISFEDSLFELEKVQSLEKLLGDKIKIIRGRYSEDLGRRGAEDKIALLDPYSVNGLEFKCVILVGVDEGRVPQNMGVSDISANYLRYVAFNQLYLTASRAKYRLIILGNELHGVSSCLQYALGNERIQKIR